MRWIVLTLVFVLGFAVGAWRAAEPKRGLIACALALPLLIAVLMGGYALYLALTVTPVENFNDVAAAATGIVGAGLAILAFVGGLFGAWYRRAGIRRP